MSNRSQRPKEPADSVDMSLCNTVSPSKQRPVVRRSTRNAGKQTTYDIHAIFSKIDLPEEETPHGIHGTTARDPYSLYGGEEEIIPVTGPIVDRKRDFPAVTDSQTRPARKKRLYTATRAQTAIQDIPSDEDLPSDGDYGVDDVICADDFFLDTDESDGEEHEVPDSADTAERAIPVKVPAEDEFAVRTFLKDQKAKGSTRNYTNPGNPDAKRQEILDVLGYQGRFTNWRTVLLSLARTSLVQHHITSLEAFMEALTARGPFLAVNDVGAFLEQPNDKSWFDDDKEITAEWNGHVCPRVAALAGPGLDIQTMSKPSGNIHATLTLVLHYPTFTTQRPRGGLTFDPSNTCLHVIKEKIGPSRAVKVQDRTMVRHKFDRTVKWADVYPKWAEIEETFLAFNRFLNKDSPVLLFMGKQNCRRDRVEELIQLNPPDEICWLEIKLPGTTKMFQQCPAFGVIKNRVTGVIRHIVFLRWHPQRFSYPAGSREAVYHDLVYNVCAELARIDSVNESYFAQTQANVGNQYQSRNVLNSLRTYEKETGPLDEALVRCLLANLLNDNPDLFSPLPPAKSGSLVGGIIGVLLNRARLKSQAALGWPNLVKARAAYAAAGFPITKHKTTPISAPIAAEPQAHLETLQPRKQRRTSLYL